MHDRRRWLWAAAGLVVLGLVTATAVALTRNGADTTEVVQDDPAASSTTSTPTTLATTTTTAPTTTDGPAVTTTTRPAPPTAPAPGPVPGAVTVIRGGPGGGSGEIMVEWDAVAGATGYRVLRSDTAGGPYAVAADYDVATGHATTADDGIFVWSPTGSSHFQYIEVGEERVRWFQVVAYNAAGDAPPSAAVSGSPP
jgi:hypothetical protein